MGSFLDEEVPPVNPLGVAAIQELAVCFLKQVAPKTLKKPQPLDVVQLADIILPKYGIHVQPATREELGDRFAATDPLGDDEINILVREDVWDKLPDDGPTSFFPRSTVCHEVGHALLHVPVLRRRLLLQNNVLARSQRKDLPAYIDPEWQAWVFAGSTLMPQPAIEILSKRQIELNAANFSKFFQVSEKMAQTHIDRLNRNSGGQK